MTTREVVAISLQQYKLSIEMKLLMILHYYTPFLVPMDCSLITSHMTLANNNWLTRWQEITRLKNCTAAVSIDVLSSTDIGWKYNHMTYDWPIDDEITQFKIWTVAAYKDALQTLA